jgi:hypothetical protein
MSDMPIGKSEYHPTPNHIRTRVEGGWLYEPHRGGGITFVPDPPVRPIFHQGCICPPGAEKTCQGGGCPRRGVPVA